MERKTLVSMSGFCISLVKFCQISIGVSLLTMSCTSAQGQKVLPESAFALNKDFQLVLIKNDAAQDFRVNDTMYIYYFGEYIACRLSADRVWETNVKINGSEPIFIYKYGDSIGYWFRKIEDTTYMSQRSVDSLLVAYNFRFDIPDLRMDTSWSCLSELRGDVLIENYWRNKATFEEGVDTVKFFYSTKLRFAKYSISRKIDESRGMKLFKTEQVINQRASTKFGTNIPARKITFEFWEKGEIEDDIRQFVIRIIKLKYSPNLMR